MGLGRDRETSILAAGWFVASVFPGSAASRLILSTTIGWLRERFTLRHLRWVNLFSELLMADFGVAALLAWGNSSPDAALKPNR